MSERIQIAKEWSTFKKSVNDRLLKIKSGQLTANPEHRQSKSRPADVLPTSSKQSVNGRLPKVINETSPGEPQLLQCEKPVTQTSEAHGTLIEPLTSSRLISDQNIQKLENEIRQKKLELRKSIIEEKKMKLLNDQQRNHDVGSPELLNLAESSGNMQYYPVPPPPSPVTFVPSQNPFNFVPPPIPASFPETPIIAPVPPIQIAPMANETMQMSSINCLIQLSPAQQVHLQSVASYIGTNQLKTSFDVFVSHWQSIGVPLNLEAAINYLTIQGAPIVYQE